MKKLFSIIFIAALFVACGNNDGDKAKINKKGDKTEAIAQLKFDNFRDNAADYLDKEIKVSGSVVHVCEHSGKKMFIVGTNPDTRLKITAGDEIGKFPMELLGSDIVVHGVLKEVISVASPKAEGEEHKKGEVMEGMEGEACETETALAGQTTLATLVLEYRGHEVK